ncbi:zinc-binding oxidoreductase CipB [Hypoxylon fuscum]|nr:zinc-binding oxidoreductase CipB [Hypoxylon fuscum]
MPPENRAAYLVDKHGKPLEVRPAPYTAPGPDEFVIKSEAVAINPVDAAVQLAGNTMFPWLKYSCIQGSDVSGVVVDVGSGGKAEQLFEAGDAVAGLAVGTDKRANKASEGAFQQYTVLRCQLTSKISDDLPCERACVLPLALSTAACGLFMADHLALDKPRLLPPAAEEARSSTAVVVVWRGSTSVGSNVIQLAQAAGYEVLSTASPKNFKSLGATMVFDYKEADTVARIIDALRGKTCAGALAIGVGSLEACIDIVAAVPGRKFVSRASVPVDMKDVPKSMVGFLKVMIGLMWWNISIGLKAMFKRVSTKFIWGTDLMENEIGLGIYHDFLPDALAKGQYQANLDPVIAGAGLESIQKGIEVCKKGVSAAKVVVTL